MSFIMIIVRKKLRNSYLKKTSIFLVFFHWLPLLHGLGNLGGMESPRNVLGSAKFSQLIFFAIGQIIYFYGHMIRVYSIDILHFIQWMCHFHRFYVIAKFFDTMLSFFQCFSTVFVYDDDV